MTQRYYIRHMENIGLIRKDAAVLRALDLGCGKGHDSEYLASLGYRVTAVDTERHYAKALISDIRTFTIETNSYSVIICNNVLPFISEKGSVEMILIHLTQGLISGGSAFVTFYGPNSSFKGRSDMSFFEYAEVLALIESLPVEILDKTTSEGYTLNGAGEIIYQHSHRFILKRGLY